MNKKCMKCGKPATHKFVRNANGQVVDIFYCTDHAAEASPYQKPKVPLGEIIAGFLGQEQAKERSGEPVPRCRACSLSFNAYRKTLFLGCPRCYDSFADLLLPDLYKFHGAIQHVGRRPGGGLEVQAGLPAPASSPDLAPSSPAAGGPTPGSGAIVEVPSGEAAAKPAPVGEAIDDRPIHEQLAECVRLMNEAIQSEDFERAASYRDRIRDLKSREGK